MKKKLFSLSLILFSGALCLYACEGTDRQVESKIAFSYYDSNEGYSTVSDIDSLPVTAFPEKTKLSMQIQLTYEPISEALYQSQKNEGESYVDFSQRYHAKKNREILSELDLSEHQVMISEYAPFIFITCAADEGIESTYALAKDIAKSDAVHSIKICPSDMDYALPAA
jgi:hypothetical protein